MRARWEPKRRKRDVNLSGAVTEEGMVRGGEKVTRFVVAECVLSSAALMQGLSHLVIQERERGKQLGFQGIVKRCNYTASTFLKWPNARVQHGQQLGSWISPTTAFICSIFFFNAIKKQHNLSFPNNISSGCGQSVAAVRHVKNGTTVSTNSSWSPTRWFPGELEFTQSVFPVTDPALFSSFALSHVRQHYATCFCSSMNFASTKWAQTREQTSDQEPNCGPHWPLSCMFYRGSEVIHFIHLNVLNKEFERSKKTASTSRTVALETWSLTLLAI